MPSRLSWFVAGAGAGAAGSAYVRHKLRHGPRKPAPKRATTETGARVKAAASEARAALAEGTAAVRRYRAEVDRRAVDPR